MCWNLASIGNIIVVSTDLSLVLTDASVCTKVVYLIGYIYVYQSCKYTVVLIMNGIVIYLGYNNVVRKGNLLWYVRTIVAGIVPFPSPSFWETIQTTIESITHLSSQPINQPLNHSHHTIRIRP